MKALKLDSKIYHIIKSIRIAVLAMGTAILFFACNDNDIDKIQAFLSPDDLPTQEVSNFESLQSDSGHIRSLLKAPKLLRYENGGKRHTEFPQGIELAEYDEKQRIISTVTADYGKHFDSEKKFEVKNNVIVTNSKGDTLKTEHLIWDEKLEKIHTEEFVKIISKDQIITGIGLTSDQNMANWEIKDVKGVIYLDVKKQEKKDTEISPGITVDPKSTRPSPQPVKFN